MVSNIQKAFQIPDIRRKIIITFIILALYRFLAHIPVPNVNVEAIRLLFESNQVLNFINLFSGGGLSNLSIISLGVGPYITASIIMQLLTMVVPKLEELSKEGQFGRQKINQYTQALTLPLALIQSYGLFFILSKQTLANGASLVGTLTTFELLVMIITMTAGTFFLMWIAEIITEYGVGNGVSVIIFAGILAGIPTALVTSMAIGGSSQIINVVIFILVAIGIFAGVVYVNEAYRKIQIQYSSKVRGGKVQGGGSSYIPIKINQAGVIPIIFAVSLIMLPSVMSGYFQNSTNPELVEVGVWLSIYFAPGTALYNLSYFLLVFGFTYFYTAVTFNPEKIADEIRKSGGFIPGIRPGKATVSYLGYIINRLTFAGGIFLGLIAVVPSIIQNMTGVTALAIGGTGLLIVVSVVLETVKQIESQVITREYESFTK